MKKIRLIAVAAVVLAALAGFAFGTAAAFYYLRVATAGGSASHRHKLAAGFYWGRAKGLLYSFTVKRNGTLEFSGTSTVGRKDRGFLVRYTPDRIAGVPSVELVTTVTPMPVTRRPRRTRFAKWQDLGFYGRASMKARMMTSKKRHGSPLWRVGGKWVRGAAGGPLWRLGGKWVQGAKLSGNFLVYRGVHYRFDRATGRWMNNLLGANRRHRGPAPRSSPDGRRGREKAGTADPFYEELLGKPNGDSHRCYGGTAEANLNLADP